MAGSVNKCMIIGNLGADPDIRTMQSGAKVANLSVATTESWKNKSTGERHERTQWHRVVIFNEGLVGVAERYLKKGHKVYIEGRVETRKYTGQDGIERYTTEIVLRPYHGDLTMLESRGGNAPPAADDPDAYGSSATRTSGANPPQADDFNDDIPF